MRCPKCQTENHALAKFCTECGAALDVSCGACGATAVPGQRFCGQCGAVLLGQSPRADPPASYTPKYLADKIFSSRATMEGERKQVTVLFCDIAGSTGLAHRIGAESMHALLNRFFDAALAEVHRYEGTLNQFLGDGFMALFGAPIAHEDHARRAAHAALSIRRACHAASAELAEGRAPLRFGLNTGPVVVGKIGDNLRMDYTAIGDTTNLAARMQQLATPGEILLAAHTWELARNHFHCEALGQRRVRGNPDGIPVYRLHDVRSSAQSGGSIAATSLSQPMVGRSRELALVRECISRLRDGRGGIVGVVGEAGLGKSRLLLEARRLDGQGVCWLEGHALSFGRSLSYSPFIDALRGVANIDEREAGTASWAKLDTFLTAHLGSQASALLPFAGMLIGLELPAMAKGLVARLDPQDVRGQIFIAARRIFESLARKQPVVLELEDWQWADDASAGLLEHLLPLVETQGLLVCFVGRADAGSACSRVRELAAERYSHRYAEILLGPLSSSDSNQMIDNLASLDRLPPALRGVILRKVEGNPLFIEEVMRSLHGSGMVRRDPVTGAVQVAEDVESIELPDSIEAIIMARIDRLEADVKQVLRLAAVIGRSFYRRILQALDEADHQLDQCLEQLQQFELIRERRPPPELEYMFKHALVHETSYRSILEERRRELHRRVADAIETLFTDRLDELVGLLAYHYAHAGEWSKAQRYLLRAGDQAARMSADVDALAHYRAALESCARALGERWDKRERASLERKIGEAYFRLGQHEQASEHLHTALALLGGRYPRTTAGVLASIAAQALQQLWHQLRRRRYRHSGEDLSGEDVDRLRALVSLGWLDWFRDERRFFLDVLSGLNWAERRGLGAAVAQGLMGVGFACDALRLPALAGHYHRRALSVAAQLEDPVAGATARFGEALHQMMVGEWTESIAGMEHAMHAFDAQGKLREQAVSAATLIWVLLQRGEIERGRRINDELTQRASDAADAHGALLGASHRAWFEMQDGRLEQAAADMDRALDGLRRIPDYQVLCDLLGQRAICAQWLGDCSGAQRWIEEGRRVMRARTIAPQLTTALRAANGWLAIQRLGTAPPQERAAALRQANEAVRVLHRLERVYAGAAPIASCVEGCVAWMRGRARVAHGAWSRSIEAAEKIGHGYQLAITHQQMGRLQGSRTDLEQALSLFESCGLKFQSAQTLHHLGQLLARSDPPRARECFERSLAAHASMTAPHERRLVERTRSTLRAS